MPAQGTRWPPVGVPQAFSRPALPRSKAPAARPVAGTGHAALALSLLAGGLRRLAALLTR